MAAATSAFGWMEYYKYIIPIQNVKSPADEISMYDGINPDAIEWELYI